MKRKKVQKGVDDSESKGETDEESVADSDADTEDSESNGDTDEETLDSDEDIESEVEEVTVKI